MRTATTRIFIVIFIILGAISLGAAIKGATHQFWIAGICAIAVVVNFKVGKEDHDV